MTPFPFLSATGSVVAEPFDSYTNTLKEDSIQLYFRASRTGDLFREPDIRLFVQLRSARKPQAHALSFHDTHNTPDREIEACA